MQRWFRIGSSVNREKGIVDGGSQQLACLGDAWLDRGECILGPIWCATNSAVIAFHVLCRHSVIVGFRSRVGTRLDGGLG